MAAPNPCKVVFGAAGPLWREHAAEIIEILREAGIKKIDAAQVYHGSEKTVGDVDAGRYFDIDTKELGCGGIIVGQGPATKENVIQRGLNSLELLKVDQVDIFYIHGPDRETPFEDTLEGINELYKMGKFRRFGLSNYLPCEVEKVVQICKAKGFVSPTVYEGNYNPISRKPEEVFFPMLRKHNMVFYAYSPLAGGFLAKTKEEILARQCPKFDPENGLVGMIYSALYNKPSHFEALEEWGAISRTFGLTKPEMAYRWVAFHSPLDRARGDAMIIGASKLEQLREIVQWLGKGPLPAEVVDKIENVWRIVQHDAGLDNYNLNSFELDKTPDFKQMYEKAHENLPRTTQHQSSSTRSQSGIAAV